MPDKLATWDPAGKRATLTVNPTGYTIPPDWFRLRTNQTPAAPSVPILPPPVGTPLSPSFQSSSQPPAPPPLAILQAPRPPVPEPRNTPLTSPPPTATPKPLLLASTHVHLLLLMQLATLSASQSPQPNVPSSPSMILSSLIVRRQPHRHPLPLMIPYLALIIRLSTQHLANKSLNDKLSARWDAIAAHCSPPSTSPPSPPNDSLPSPKYPPLNPAFSQYITERI
ncbi:hypothetical protein SARC_03157 [Sphaeroforma arctica JP610]|uniref:Uncharacterized protein n=1 Tax=Sphaeroforma arctica JP610 TaxID=667725 RepID=A0A0L0G6K0_9EUKA|nr:hypothetical protein SARC_03157 [Sphaeroforma arctica JP610]KNC84627.1 hypothetical protein SARC_03157 [Sphaeroforma arctica JP610]|eukprot:XP_014158529.1 hypothetical protein SARC_03157 [Sphaeroforma arctica JP610]